MGWGGVEGKETRRSGTGSSSSIERYGVTTRPRGILDLLSSELDMGIALVAKGERDNDELGGISVMSGGGWWAPAAWAGRRAGWSR